MNGANFKVGNVVKNTDTDFDLILEPVDIPFPEIKTKYIEKAFGDGSIDLTEADGNIYFKDRSFSLTFIALNKVLYKETLNKLLAFLHGQKVDMTFWFDEEYYYEGRVSINQYKCKDYLGEIVCDVQTRPYKYKQNIRTETPTSNASSFKSYTYKNGRMPAVPTFSFSGTGGQIKFKGQTYSITGESIFPDIVFKYGDNSIEFKGSGTWTVKWREGDL